MAAIEQPCRCAGRARWPIIGAAAAALLAAFGVAALADSDDEFDFSRHSIPLEQIVAGGPAKDGIPALDGPRSVDAAAADFLAGDDRVVGVFLDDVAKAYPLRILNWHEVVNDRLGETLVAVTYCPLTGSAVVFDRRVGDQTASFGVSGRLYESNVLLYDRRTDSLWSQLAAAAVTGPLTGTRLEALPIVVTSWAAWRAAHPDTQVLSRETGHSRDYEHHPYENYEASGSLMFRPSHRDRRLPAKQRVLGLSIDGETRAYPLSDLAALGRPLRDRLAGRELTVEFDGHGATAKAGDDLLPATSLYWFAWAAFHPETDVWRSPAPPPALPGGRLDDITIVETKSYWTSLAGAVPAMPGSDPFDSRGGLFVISGTIKNTSEQAVHHAELRFELLDADGTVVYHYDGYNRSAENLINVEDVSSASEETMKVTPIEPGATDSFRMIFIAGEIPAFEEPRVTVVSVE